MLNKKCTNCEKTFYAIKLENFSKNFYRSKLGSYIKIKKQNQKE